MTMHHQRNIFKDSTNKLDLLKMSHTLREYHHKALWEEEKHFTWLLSIFFTAEILVVTTDNLSDRIQSLLTIGISIFGFFFSLLALRVVLLESHGFQNELDNYKLLYKKVFGRESFPHDELPIGWFRRAERRVWYLIRGKSIRHHFQFIFVLFATVFLFLAGAQLLCPI